jgi:uncharacterized protein (TIGR02001 family)
MKKITLRFAPGIAAACSMLAASPSSAGFTGTLAATSEYMFRGIESSDGAAVQGSLLYSHATGLYAGAWGSNIDEALGSTEVDVYGGWAGEVGPVTLDVGAIQYLFLETNEDDAIDNTDYVEIYGGVSVAGVSTKVFLTHDFFNTDEEAIYATASYAFPIKDDLTLTPQVGYSDGDGVDAFIGDSYFDYSVTLTKAFESGFGASFAVINTTLDETEAPALFTSDDSPKFVVSLTKSFDL